MRPLDRTFDERYFSGLRQTFRAVRQTIMVKRCLSNSLQSSSHIGSESCGRAQKG
jgi:hypothetical protein